MAIKACLLLSLVIMFLSQNVIGFPRDSGPAVIEDVSRYDNAAPKTKLDEPAPKPVPFVHRVECGNEEEEPAEDAICQEHCLPKGYSYGLCISKRCTCV